MNGFSIRTPCMVLPSARSSVRMAVQPASAAVATSRASQKEARPSVALRGRRCRIRGYGSAGEYVEPKSSDPGSVRRNHHALPAHDSIEFGDGLQSEPTFRDHRPAYDGHRPSVSHTRRAIDAINKNIGIEREALSAHVRRLGRAAPRRCPNPVRIASCRRSHATCCCGVSTRYFATGVRRATGLPLRVITNSSPPRPRGCSERIAGWRRAG